MPRLDPRRLDVQTEQLSMLERMARSPWAARGVDLWSISAAERFAQIAVHESGHAVIGVRRGFDVLDVQLGDSSDCPSGLAAGGTRFDAPSGDQVELAKAHPRKIAPVLLAGSLAEQLILGRYVEDGYLEDFRIMRIGLGWIEALTDEQCPDFRGLMALSQQVVLSEEQAIRKVATALVVSRRLDRPEILELVA